MKASFLLVAVLAVGGAWGGVVKPVPMVGGIDMSVETSDGKMAHFSVGQAPAGEVVQSPWTPEHPIHESDKVQIFGVAMGVPVDSRGEKERFSWARLLDRGAPIRIWGTARNCEPIKPPFMVEKTGRELGRGYHSVEFKFATDEGHMKAGSAFVRFYVDDDPTPTQPSAPAENPELANLRTQVSQLEARIRLTVSQKNMEVGRFTAALKTAAGKLSEGEKTLAEAKKRIADLEESKEALLNQVTRASQAFNELGVVVAVGNGPATVRYEWPNGKVTNVNKDEKGNPLMAKRCLLLSGFTVPCRVTVTIGRQTMTAELDSEKSKRSAVLDFGAR